jgi:putative PIN family toxin of toxin-antitoxin system
MVSKKIRIIIDTNLWISFLISKSFIRIDKLIQYNKIEILFSEDLLQEFADVIQKPKFKKFFSWTDIDALFTMFRHYGQLIEVHSKVNICRDTDDNFLLALAKDGKADYLLTGDNDLLIIGKFGRCHILTYSVFEKMEIP